MAYEITKVHMVSNFAVSFKSLLKENVFEEEKFEFKGVICGKFRFVLVIISQLSVSTIRKFLKKNNNINLFYKNFKRLRFRFRFWL